MPLFGNQKQSIPALFIAKQECDAKIAELFRFKTIDIRDIPVLKWHLLPLKLEQQRLRDSCEKYIKDLRANA